MTDISKEQDTSQIDERIIERIAILKHQTIFAHDKIIEEYGGAKGIRDEAVLEAAVAAPFATFWGEDLYPTTVDKAACLWRSLSVNHPMIDGNKRTSLIMTANFLFECGQSFNDNVSDDELFNLSIDIAKGDKGVMDISSWLEQNTSKASARSFRTLMKQLHNV